MNDSSLIHSDYSCCDTSREYICYLFLPRSGDGTRLAVPTEFWGKVKDDVEQLKSVRAGAAIEVKKVG